MATDHVPVACSLDSTGMAARKARWQSLADTALLRSQRIQGGARQIYRATGDSAKELGELVELEARCCPFLRFDLRHQADNLVLEVHGPDSSGPALALFAEATPSAPQVPVR